MKSVEIDQKDIQILNAVTGFTMTSPERILALTGAVRHIVRRGIPGSIVECGVWRGGSMMAAALALIQEKQIERELYLFDTFDGMPPPEDVDRDLENTAAADLLAKSNKMTDHCWAYSRLEEVQKNLASTGYDRDRLHFVEGMVEETIPDSAPSHIAILRLDTDWYSSTKHELEHLYSRLAVGGILIIDDYGHWKGARKAVDEFFANHNLPPMLLRIDYTGRIAVKEG